MIKLIAVLTLAILAGCSKDDISQYASNPKSISVTTAGATRSSLPFDTDKNFYLYVDQTGEANDYFVKMFYEGSKWVARNTEDNSLVNIPMVDAAQDINISALYCGDKVLSLDEYISNLTEYSYTTDLLYANTTLSQTVSINEEGDVEVTFKHLLSSMRVNVETNKQISSATIYGVNSAFKGSASTGFSTIEVIENGSTPISFTPNEVVYLPAQQVGAMSVNILTADGLNYTDTRNNIELIAAQGVALTIKIP